jgi:hypothetical protein
MEHMGFFNLTTFAAEQFLLADEQGADLLVLVAKATYRIEGRDRLVLDAEQIPVDPAGSFHGEPEASSLKNAPEASFVKLATDVAMIGHAHAPQGKPVTTLDVSLRVGPVRKTVRVFGDREWRPGLLPGSKSMTGPKPFAKMPLVYERAFGGADLTPDDPGRHERDARNPVGVGLIAKASRTKEPVAAPNLEDPEALIRSASDRPVPAGFGFIAPHWESRLRYAGTYDDAWRKERLPLLPEDFDRHFFSAAHADLIAPGFLKGGEPVEVVNASPHGRLAFSLPTDAPEGVVMMKDQTRHALAMNLDTVVMDTDEHRAYLVWRGNLPVYKQVHDILWAKVQPTGSGKENSRAA